MRYSLQSLVARTVSSYAKLHRGTKVPNRIDKFHTVALPAGAGLSKPVLGTAHSHHLVRCLATGPREVASGSDSPKAAGQAKDDVPTGRNYVEIEGLNRPDYDEFEEAFADSPWATTWEPDISLAAVADGVKAMRPDLLPQVEKLRRIASRKGGETSAEYLQLWGKVTDELWVVRLRGGVATTLPSRLKEYDRDVEMGMGRKDLEGKYSEEVRKKLEERNDQLRESWEMDKRMVKREYEKRLGEERKQRGVEEVEAQVEAIQNELVQLEPYLKGGQGQLGQMSVKEADAKSQKLGRQLRDLEGTLEAHEEWEARRSVILQTQVMRDLISNGRLELDPYELRLYTACFGDEYEGPTPRELAKLQKDLNKPRSLAIEDDSGYADKEDEVGEDGTSREIDYDEFDKMPQLPPLKPTDMMRVGLHVSMPVTTTEPDEIMAIVNKYDPNLTAEKVLYGTFNVFQWCELLRKISPEDKEKLGFDEKMFATVDQTIPENLLLPPHMKVFPNLPYEDIVEQLQTVGRLLPAPNSGEPTMGALQQWKSSATSRLLTRSLGADKEKFLEILLFAGVEETKAKQYVDGEPLPPHIADRLTKIVHGSVMSKSPEELQQSLKDAQANTDELLKAGLDAGFTEEQAAAAVKMIQGLDAGILERISKDIVAGRLPEATRVDFDKLSKAVPETDILLKAAAPDMVLPKREEPEPQILPTPWGRKKRDLLRTDRLHPRVLRIDANKFDDVMREFGEEFLGVNKPVEQAHAEFWEKVKGKYLEMMDDPMTREMTREDWDELDDVHDALKLPIPPDWLAKYDDFMENPHPGCASLQYEVLDVNFTSKTTKSGKIRSQTVLVVAGDCKGRVGYGSGKGENSQRASAEAVRRAARNLMNVEINDDGSLPHDVIGHYVSTTVKLFSKPIRADARKNYIIAHRLVESVLECAGVKSAATKIYGSKNPQNIVKATVEALLKCRKRTYYPPKVLSSRMRKHYGLPPLKNPQAYQPLGLAAAWKGATNAATLHRVQLAQLQV